MRVDPNPIWLCPYKKRTFGHTDTRDAHTQKGPFEDTAREWPSASQGKRLQDKPILLTLRPWTSNFQDHEKTNFCCLSHPGYTFCYGSSSPMLLQGCAHSTSLKASLCLTLRKLVFASADSPYTKASLVWCQNPLSRDTFFLSRQTECFKLSFFHSCLWNFLSASRHVKSAVF